MIEIKLPNLKNDAFSIYQFGSSLYDSTPNDIDLAIIYDKNFISIKDAIQLRKYVCSLLREQHQLPIDILLLTLEEEKETDFLLNAKHLALKTHTTSSMM